MLLLVTYFESGVIRRDRGHLLLFGISFEWNYAQELWSSSVGGELRARCWLVKEVECS